MAEEVLNKVTIDRWVGRISNRDTHDEPQALMVADNVQTNTPGELKVRKGYRIIAWGNTPQLTTGSVLAMTTYSLPDRDLVFLQNDGAGYGTPAGETGAIHYIDMSNAT